MLSPSFAPRNVSASILCTAQKRITVSIVWTWVCGDKNRTPCSKNLLKEKKNYIISYYIIYTFDVSTHKYGRASELKKTDSSSEDALNTQLERKKTKCVFLVWLAAEQCELRERHTHTNGGTQYILLFINNNARSSLYCGIHGSATYRYREGVSSSQRCVAHIYIYTHL